MSPQVTIAGRPPDGPSTAIPASSRVPARVHRLVLSAGLVLAAACESSTAPHRDSIPITAGTPVTGSLTASDAARTFTFVTAPASKYVVFATVSESTLTVELEDSSTVHIASGGLSASTAPLAQSPVLQFLSSAGGTRFLTVTGHPTTAAVTFAVLVYLVDDAPESRPAAFTIGDTVSGETIDPVADVDVFTAHVAAGQQIVAVAEAPSISGLGPLTLTITDSSGVGLPAYASFPTGGPASVTTGRVRIGPGTYQFRFEPFSAAGGLSFLGAYRFWTYAVNPGPEHLTATVATDSIVKGESIDRTGDVDEFTFTAAAGAEVNAFFQSPTASHLDIVPASGATLASVTAGRDTGLYAAFSGRVTLPTGGAYTARVTADGTTLADTGAYRFFLYAIDHRPEHVAAAIVPGDTVSGESIDLPGDVDEFTFTPTAGEAYRAFLQAQSGSAATHFQLDVLDPGGTVLTSITSTGVDTNLIDQVTAPLQIQVGGTYRLRIGGVGTNGGSNAGPYRLLLYHPNPKPESVPDTLALGDSVTAEAIDLPGDLDEYRIHVPDSSGANLVVAFDAAGTLRAQLLDSVADTVLYSATSGGGGAPGQTGTLKLGPGTYIVRVQADPYFEQHLHGPYRLWLYRFSFEPETVRDTIAVGDTIQGEAVDVPGDVDTYHFYGVLGQHVNLMLQGLVALNSSGAFWAWVYGPGHIGPIALLVSPSQGSALTDYQTLRMDLPASGWYTLTVSVADASPVPAQRRPYRFAVIPVSSAPETHGASLAVGDSVTTEAIDVRGDWDQFALTATPGEELYALFGDGAMLGANPSIQVLDSAGDTLAANVGQGLRVVGPFRVPPAGAVEIAVFEVGPTYRQCMDSGCPGIYAFTGQYILQMRVLRRAPETATAVYVLGDTISTEAIDTAGDIDEFHLTATPGDTLSAWYRLGADPQPAGSLISLEVIDSATGSSLVQSEFVYRAGSDFLSPGPFVVPASGRVTIRFRGTGFTGWDIGTGPYEFYVKRGP